MTDARIKKILIVGGGTAGWLSAAYLNRVLGESVEITLVESSTVAPVGVGEATLPTLRATMSFLGFRDEDWMPEIGATYKSAIHFVGWIESPGYGEATSYWHPFATRPEPHVLPFERPFFPEVGAGFSLLHYALKKRLGGSTTPLAQTIVPTPAICARKLSPKHPTEPSFDLVSAYHVDAGLLGAFLRKVATERGVTHVVDDVVDVRLRERGFIHHVKTKGGRVLCADLFIDCSGFRGMLLNGALGEPFESGAEHLLCDSAVAISCRSRPEHEGLNPYTTATALRCGWAWDIPLYHRSGCGYVYSGDVMTPTTAEAELRAFLGERAEGADAKHIKMRVGQSRNLWVNNCVAVGLAGSFIEPLESTGIFLIEYGLATLVNLFPDKGGNSARRKQYNRAMRDMYEETRDFVVLHYWVSRRRDTEFWKAVKHEARLPESLREKLAFLELSLPTWDPLKLTIFRSFNYACILDGAGRLPKRPLPVLEHTGYEAGEQALRRIRERTELLVAKMPGHYDYLTRMSA